MEEGYVGSFRMIEETERWWSRSVVDNMGNSWVRMTEAQTAIDSATAANTLHIGTDVLIITASIGLLFLIALVGSVFTVSQQEPEIIERFGKFNRVAMPGLRFKIPFMESRVWEADLRVQSLDIEVETKTKDNVFVKVRVALQYSVLPDAQSVYNSYYMLTDDEEQIKSYVFDVVRSLVPKMMLDDTFEQKDDIAKAVDTDLTEAMKSFGFKINRALVTDIEPAQVVKQSMNAINAATRDLAAAEKKGETEKLLLVKAAEARQQSDELAGKGIAAQRKAIVDGLRESVAQFQEAVPGMDAKEVMNVVLMTQYMDALKQIGDDSKVIFVSHLPGAVQNLSQQMQEAIEATKV